MKRRSACRVGMSVVCSLFVIARAEAATRHPTPGHTLPGGSLDPNSIPKYVDPLPLAPLMPAASANTYDIAARPSTQQVLPSGFPRTTIFAYGATGSGSFTWPAATIEVQQGTPTTVTWHNQLQNAKGGYLPHPLTIDPTLHWANPPGPVDTRPTFASTPPPYDGPIPLVTHLHGAHVDPESDGFPEAWFLPSAKNIVDCAQGNAPGCFFTHGSNYANAPGFTARPGQATYVYRNDQRAATLWYHDHALGMTRANVQMGLAGFYLVRDAYEKGLDLPGPYGKYEIPLVIQDRSFNTDGSIFFPTSRVFFDGFAGPYLPTPGSDVSPYYNSEYFGNTMTVNGKTWPRLTVERRKYRFRFLNGCDSRWLQLQFADPKLKPTGLELHVIGTDGGFVTGAPLATDSIRLAPAERNDVIVDFSAVPAGTRLVLTNVAPDEPFGGTLKTSSTSDAGTTGQVMAFDVVAATGPDTSVLPASLHPPSDGFEPKGNPVVRNLTITEFDSIIDPAGPSEAQLGNAAGPLPWGAPISEHIRQGTTERWNIVNRTADAHPIHLHQTQFRVVGRVPIDLASYDAAIAACQKNPAATNCPPDPAHFVKKGASASPPFAWEAGPKDTLQTNPGEMTTLDAFFDIPGLYVWHCHIISHEDNEMMRPLCVSPDPSAPVCNQ
jgi:FtsP/CotA-like multicopper oxidase with cupredoxin domain